MKLSTLLLSSAAVIVAGSAYAADLPAKKGAPAAKPAATGCPAFGAGFFQIPGSDTCINFSGYMYGLVTAGSTSTAMSSAGRVIFDVRSNSELGTVRGVIRSNFTPSASSYVGAATTSSSADGDRAYAQLAGLTAGKYGSSADISGSQGFTFGSGLGGGSGTGVKYDFAAGPATITLAAEQSVDRSSTAYSATQPDLMAKVSMAAGPGKITVMGVSHKNDTNQGYAYLGAASMPVGPATFGVYGGSSYGAVAYTGTLNSALTTTADVDTSALGGTTSGTNYGGYAAYDTGKGPVYVDYSYITAASSNVSNNKGTWGIGYQYKAGGGFVVMPELLVVNKNANGTTSTSNTLYLYIKRDF